MVSTEQPRSNAERQKPDAGFGQGRPPIRQVNPLEEADWDRLALAHADSSFFHGSAWARVLRESYGFEPVYLAAVEPGSGRLCGLLAVMEVKSPLTGRRGVSLPFTDACAPLASEAVSVRALLHELGEVAKARGWRYWECRGVKALPEEMAASVSFYGHVLDLSAGERGLIAGLKPPVRRAIRKAEEAGVEVEPSASLEAMRTFYRLNCRTRRKHGLPPQPFRFFENIYRHIVAQGYGRVFVARVGGRAIAANLYLESGTKVIYKYGASDERFQELRGSNLVMWRAIDWYSKGGMHSMDFGRTATTAKGLRRFKLGWGSEEERIDYLRHDCRAGRFVTMDEERFTWQNAVMARMPLMALRILGRVLYRHVA